jgi:hypothetical protein
MSFEGKTVEYTWLLYDGSESRGATVERTYKQKGTFTEILRVKDDQGNTAHNISTVYVVDPSDSGFGRMWVTYSPSRNVKPGDNIGFEAKIVFAEPADGSKEVWDFGDGSPLLETEPGRESGRPSRTYSQSGDYIVRVACNDVDGNQCVARVVVHVE